MVVCICKNIRTKDIQAEMCKGPCRMKDLRDKLGLATQCTKCAATALEILRANPTLNGPTLCAK